MAQAQQSINHLNTLSHLRVLGAKALERRYNDLRDRYSKLYISTKYTTNPSLFEHALRCGVEFSNDPAATLPSTLSRFGAKIMFSRRFLQRGLLGNARKALRQAGRRFGEARVLFGELEASLEGLEMAQRATLVYRRWSVVVDQLLGFERLYADVREWWECIEEPVREEARLETDEIRICIVELQTRSNAVSLFQQQRNKIAAALCAVHRQIVEADFEAIETMLVDAGRQCDLLGAYLVDLRSAVEKYEAIEEEVLRWRRTNGQVGGIDYSEESAHSSTRSDSGFGGHCRSQSVESGVQFSMDVDGSHGRGDGPLCRPDSSSVQQDAASECDTELEVTSREEFQHTVATSFPPRVALGGCGNKGPNEQKETTRVVRGDSGPVGGW